MEFYHGRPFLRKRPDTCGWHTVAIFCMPGGGFIISLAGCWQAMKAAVFHEHGPLDNLITRITRIRNRPDGSAATRARGRPHGFDPMVLRGIPGLKTPLPMIPGADIAGRDRQAWRKP